MDPNKIEQLRLRLGKDSDIGIHGILDSQAARYYEEENDKDYADIRPPFFRDVDRIVHSKNENNVNPHTRLICIVQVPVTVALIVILKVNGCVFAGDTNRQVFMKTPFNACSRYIGAL